MATQFKTPRIDDKPEGSEAFSKAWFSFFESVARRLSGAGSLAQITTADATDLPTAIALANANKATINAILSELGK